MRSRYLILLLFLSFFAISSHAQNTNYIAVVSQRFEGGEMIYRRDNGDIYIISNSSGRWWLFESGAYGQLSTNQATAPNNRISPLNGFGRIWANNSELRQELGWAVLPEIGFEMRFSAYSTDRYLTRLNGIILQLYQDGRWRTISTIPTRNGVSINRFVVSPDTVAKGGQISISWEASGSDFVQISMIDTANRNGATAGFYDNMPLSGDLEWTIPETVTGNIEVAVWLVNHVRFQNGRGGYEWLTSLSREVSLFQDNNFRVESDAAYQSFEHGFMLWRQDTGDVRVFYHDGRWQLLEEHLYRLNSDNLWEIPQDCFEVVNAFGKIWASYGDIRDDLGCANSGEQGYTLIITSEANGAFRYTLPDGRTIRINGSTWNF